MSKIVPTQYAAPGSGLKPLVLRDLAGKSDARFSPYCYRIKLALLHKRLPYITKPWRFTEKDVLPKDSWRNAGKPTGRVPVLEDLNENVTIQDSLRIASYLDEVYPDKLLIGNDAVRRNFSTLLHNHLDRNVILALAPLIIDSIYQSVAEKDKGYFLETRGKAYNNNFAAAQAANRAGKGRVAFQRSLGSIREVLKTSEFMSGTVPGWYDFQVMGVVLWGRAVDSDFMSTVLEPTDVVKQWINKMDDWIAQQTSELGVSQTSELGVSKL